MAHAELKAIPMPKPSSPKPTPTPNRNPKPNPNLNPSSRPPTLTEPKAIRDQRGLAPLAESSQARRDEHAAALEQLAQLRLSTAIL